MYLPKRGNGDEQARHQRDESRHGRLDGGRVHGAPCKLQHPVGHAENTADVSIAAGLRTPARMRHTFSKLGLTKRRLPRETPQARKSSGEIVKSRRRAVGPEKKTGEAVKPLRPSNSQKPSAQFFAASTCSSSSFIRFSITRGSSSNPAETRALSRICSATFPASVASVWRMRWSRVIRL